MMREKLDHWASGVDDVDLAWALLGLGILAPQQRTAGKAGLSALEATLGANDRKVHHWRLDTVPSRPSDWDQCLSAAELAKIMRASRQGRGVLRVALSPGSPLSTWAVWDFVRRYVPRYQVALHIRSPSARRACHFRWPVRVGYLPGPTVGSDVAELAAMDYWRGNVFIPSELSRRGPECEILVWSGLDYRTAQHDIARAVEQLDGVLADLVLLFDTSGGPIQPDMRQLNWIRASVGASGIALIADPAADHAQMTRQLCEEVAHNRPLDEALSFASAGQALLLASKALLDASWLQGKSRSVANALTHAAQADLSADPVLVAPWLEFGLPFDPAQDLGLEAVPTADEPTFGGVGLERQINRREVGGWLKKSLTTFSWSGESHEASALGRTLRALADDDITQAKPRYLQAAFVAPGRPDRPLSSLHAHSAYLVNVFIDIPRQGHLVADVAFPAPPPPDDGRAHDLRVVFWEPNLSPKPQISEISLPAFGASDPCAFQLQTGPTGTKVDARITVLHRNRVLQTGRLTATVGASGPAKWVVDAAPRQVLSGLDERLNFSMALVLNDMDGQGAAHVMAGKDAAVLNVDDDAITELVKVLGRAIGDITSTPADYLGLRAAGSEKLLRTLAQKGAILREYLERHAIRKGRLDPPTHVQVVATKPGKIFPIEFIYQYRAPGTAATLCPGAEEALAWLASNPVSPPGARLCPGKCPDMTDRAAMKSTICPLGFWGVRCAIERKPHEPEDNQLSGQYALRLEPTRQQQRLLRPLASTVIGATDKANRSVPTAVADMVARIHKLVPGAPVVHAWSEWPKKIEEVKPATLTLVVHQEPDENGTPTIDIGSLPFLSSDLLEEEHVCVREGGPLPLVLLLGCETGTAAISYESFALRFQWRGAALVVSTIAEVLGRQAAPVAADILEAIRRVDQPTSFGEVMRSLRCRLLAEGTPMVLALVAQGDADWEVVA